MGGKCRPLQGSTNNTGKVMELVQKGRVKKLAASFSSCVTKDLGITITQENRHLSYMCSTEWFKVKKVSGRQKEAFKEQKSLSRLSWASNQEVVTTEAIRDGDMTRNITLSVWQDPYQTVTVDKQGNTKSSKQMYNVIIAEAQNLHCHWQEKENRSSFQPSKF